MNDITNEVPQLLKVSVYNLSAFIHMACSNTLLLLDGNTTTGEIAGVWVSCS